MDEDNINLEADPMDGIRKVVFEMDGEIAVGPDGFTDKFFTYTWEVIAQDVYNAVLSFFCGAKLPQFIKSIAIVLIPKVSNPQDFS